MKVKMIKTVGNFREGKIYTVEYETRNTYMIKNDKGIALSVNKKNCEEIGFMKRLNKLFKR